jgi:hypothetical protein
MFFVWSGKGIWIFGIPMISLSILLAVDHYMFPPGHRVWPISLGFAIAGVANIILGLVSRQSPPQPMLERQTGRERYMRPVCSAYWIRAEYWGAIFLALAAWFQTITPAP